MPAVEQVCDLQKELQRKIVPELNISRQVQVGVPSFLPTPVIREFDILVVGGIPRVLLSQRPAGGGAQYPVTEQIHAANFRTKIRRTLEDHLQQSGLVRIPEGVVNTDSAAVSVVGTGKDVVRQFDPCDCGWFEDFAVVITTRREIGQSVSKVEIDPAQLRLEVRFDAPNVCPRPVDRRCEISDLLSRVTIVCHERIPVQPHIHVAS